MSLLPPSRFMKVILLVHSSLVFIFRLSAMVIVLSQSATQLAAQTAETQDQRVESIPRMIQGSVHWVMPMPDGKVLLAGEFSRVQGVTRNSIARFNVDGSLDLTFDPAVGALSYIATVALQRDGKMLIAGAFINLDGADDNCVARLNPDGTLDKTFKPCKGAKSYVYSLAVQDDGKVLAVGKFTGINGVTAGNITRVNSDGTKDKSFRPGTGADSLINCIALLRDNKALIAGWFNEYNGVRRNGIARLNRNGSLDKSFGLPREVGAQISNCIGVQNDGKALIAVNSGVVRLQADGTLDPSFTPAEHSGVMRLAVQNDGKVLLAATFDNINGKTRFPVVRLNDDGTLDRSFNSGVGANERVWSVAVQSDGKVLIAGDFTEYNGIERTYIARLNPDGTLDTSFNPDKRANEPR